MTRIVERSLAPELSLVDIEADLLWHRDGRVAVVSRLEPLHEPGLSDEDFNHIARTAEDVWSGLPEGTEYQFLVLVDADRGRKQVELALPRIEPLDGRTCLLEEFRRARLAELVGGGTDHEPRGSMPQERRFYLAATFRPGPFDRSWRRDLKGRVGAWFGRRHEAGGRWERLHARVVHEATTFARRVQTALAQLGLGVARCGDADLVALVHELLNPESSGAVEVTEIPRRARLERASLADAMLRDVPWLANTSPVWTLIDDDLAVRRDHLVVGGSCVAVVSLKQLPDHTEPGILAGLLHLARGKYHVSLRVDVPRRGLELAALRAKATLADGLQLQNFLVKSDRKDAHAVAVARESDEAMERIVASTQRILGTSLQVALYEPTPEALEEAVEDVLGTLARAHGLRAVRETYRLKEAWLSMLPGSAGMETRRRRTLTPVVADILPIHGFRTGEGKVTLATPTRSLVLYDPFDTRVLPNANALVTGTSGAGKSFLVSFLLSGYDVGAAGRGEPTPYTFILDNGASYRRYAELRPDGRYVSFSFDRPPGVDPFAWSEEEGSLDEHVSRLEWLLLDLLRIDPRDEERFERVKAVLEQALYGLYREGAERSFAGLSRALKQADNTDADDLTRSLYPFVTGKFRRLLDPNPDLEMRHDVHLICYDFQGLAEHRDLASVALRLTIYQVRKWAARANRSGHRTFLVLDESWALLDGPSGNDPLTTSAAPFIAASVRMGRKEGMSVVALSQVLEDFAGSAYGAAILGNSASKFVGMPGPEGVEGLRRLLRLTDRQVEQVLRLTRSPRFHDFLLLQGELTHVVRVPGDAFSRWVFTTSPADRDRLAALEASRPDLSLLERVRFLAASEEASDRPRVEGRR